jgi:hypothetical protein
MPAAPLFPTYTPAPAIAASGVVPREVLATSTSIRRVQMPVCALNAPLRFAYGRCRVGAMLLRPVPYGRSLLLPYITARGPIDAIEAIEFEGVEPTARVLQHTYLGGADNVVDGWLQAAWAARGVVYADTLPGIANGVVQVPAGSDVVTGLTIRFRGLKVYDPRDGTQTLGNTATYKYSNNAVLCTADFIASTAYGKGETLDWTTVATCADIADQVPTGSPTRRRTLGMVFDQAQDVDTIEETLRAYAGVWIVREGGTVRFVADAPATSVFAFVPANYVAGSLRIRPRGRADTPTVCSVRWTDTSKTPWAEATTTYPPTGPGVGVQWREEVVSMPGIQDVGMATREAIRRLNEYALCDLDVALTGGPQAIALRRGDVVTVTDDGGFSSKPFRLVGHAPADAGCWNETLREYDPACYSDALGTTPTTVDTTIPLPSDPPTLTGLTATEETYQTDKGLFASRLRISWADPDWPFVREFRLAVRLGATEVHTGTANAAATSYATPALQEGQTYTIEAVVVSTAGAIGAGATTPASVAGKALVPGNVPALDGFEVGGRVFLSWDPADNPTVPGTPDPDIWGYEVRRGTTSDAWDAADIVDRLDALRVVDEGAPAGTWRYQVKAIDSVGQYSATARTKDIVVSTDSASFLVDSYAQTSPTLTNMAAFTLEPTDPHVYYVTEDGVAFGTKFSSTLATYGNVLATYHNSVTSTWLGESEDFGSLLGGQWTGTADVAALSGALTSYFGYSSDGSSWSYASGLSQKVNARFARLKHEALTTATLKVTAPTQTIRLDAIPRDETGVGTSSAAGPVTVTLTNDYIAVKKLFITPLGNTARLAVPDNIIVGDPTTFDVYIFNDAGTKISSSFRYEFQGV